MSFFGQSLIDLSLFSKSDFLSLFELAESLKKAPDFSHKSRSVALVFFENSTRTRMSFEAAAHRLGFHALYLDSRSGSSLLKGETALDTVLNIAHLEPELLIVRSDENLDMASLSQLVSVPVVNAGWGSRGHPTQALLDVYSLWKYRQNLQGFKLLIVGDVVHSRVAASHFEVFDKLGIQIALCGPDEFLGKHKAEQRSFSHIAEALSWADSVMALRVQVERHGEGLTLDLEAYRAQFMIDKNSLKNLSSEGLIMHPGPVNWGVELGYEVQNDSRNIILSQVQNGLYIRMALLKEILGVTS